MASNHNPTSATRQGSSQRPSSTSPRTALSNLPKPVRFLIETIKCYITTPFPWTTSSSFIITAAIILLSVIFLQKFRHSIFQEFLRWNEEEPIHMQLRKEKVLRECEEQLEREEAEWRRRKDQVIRERPQDMASLEYISGVPEEF